MLTKAEWCEPKLTIVLNVQLRGGGGRPSYTPSMGKKVAMDM